MTRRRFTVGGEPSELDEAAGALFAHLRRRPQADPSTPATPAARAAMPPLGARDEGPTQPDDPFRALLVESHERDPNWGRWHRVTIEGMK